jgi:hypothetical protein
VINSAKRVGVGGASQPIDSQGRTIWIADAHRDDGKRFVVRADEKLTVFAKLEISDFRAGKVSEWRATIGGHAVRD